MLPSIKACIVVDVPYQKNKLFDRLDSAVNRDDCLLPMYFLREALKEINIDLSTQDINSVEDSEIIIFNDVSFDQKPHFHTSKKVYLIMLENGFVQPRNFDQNLLQVFSKVFTYYDEFIDNKKYFKINYSFQIPEKNDFLDFAKKNKLCVMLAGNKTLDHETELYSERERVIRWFEENKRDSFDLYGTGWEQGIPRHGFLQKLKGYKRLANFPLLKNLLAKRLTVYKGRVATKKEVLRQYKFSFCFENVRDLPGYVTEKIFDCMLAGCVPIYYGANNITKYVPEDCFIDFKKFKTMNDLYDFLLLMTSDEYNKYVQAIKTYLSSSAFWPFTIDYFVRTIVSEITKDIEHANH